MESSQLKTVKFTVDEKVAAVIGWLCFGRGGKVNAFVQNLRRALYSDTLRYTTTAKLFAEITVAEAERFFLFNNAVKNTVFYKKFPVIPLSLNGYGVKNVFSEEKILLDALSEKMLVVSAYSKAILNLTETAAINFLTRMKEEEEKELNRLNERLCEIKAEKS